MCDSPCVIDIGTGQRDIGETFERYLFRMARTSDDCDMIRRNIVVFREIIGHQHSLVRDDSLDGRNDEFVIQRSGDFHQMLLQERRRGSKDQRI